MNTQIRQKRPPADMAQDSTIVLFDLRSEEHALTDTSNPRFRNPDPLQRGKRVKGMDRKRFEYRRMTPSELASALNEIDLAPNAFCRIFGTTGPVMDRWIAGEQDIPAWVFSALWIMRESPNGVAIARTAAANHILRDNQHPERGDFPYLKGTEIWEDS